MPKYNICIVPKGQSSCDKMLPSSGFLGRGYSTAEDEAQVRSNYQKLVDKGKIKSIGDSNEIIIMKHPIENSAGEITNYQWRIFPSNVDNTSSYSQKNSEEQMSTDIDTCNRALQKKENELQRLNTKYNTDIEQLIEENRNRIQGTVIPLKTVPSNKTLEDLNLIKSKVDEQTVGTEGGRRKTKKHCKKRKSTRKKYTKRRKYSRRPRTR